MILLLALVIGAGPPTREVSKVEHGRVAYTVVQTPGVGSAGHMLELTVKLEELFDTPDPSFGRRRMLAGASVIAIMIGPKDYVEAHLAAPDGDEGNFAVHFTPPRDGIYSVQLVGNAPSGIVLKHGVLVSVNVWPMLADLHPEALPKKVPLATLGDVQHGKLICARDCKGETPTSESAEAITDEALLARVAPSAPARLVDRWDLIAYLRAQTIRVRDFFPEAAAYFVEQRGPDSEAVARIKVLSGQDPAVHQGLLFVVYKGAAGARIEPADRVAKRSLNRHDRLGFVIYDGEQAIALTPKLKLVGARQHDAAGNHPVTVGDASLKRAVALARNLLDEERERADADWLQR